MPIQEIKLGVLDARYVNIAGDTMLGDLTLPNTGLHLFDTDASHDLIIRPGSNLTADRLLTLTTGDLPRTITLQGDPTLSDWFDQSVKQAASPTFVAVNTSTVSARDVNGLGLYDDGGVGIFVRDGGHVGIGGPTIPGAPLEVRGQIIAPNNSFFVTTNTWNLGANGSVLRIGHGAAAGNTYAVIDNLVAGGGLAAGDIIFNQFLGNIGIGITVPIGKEHIYSGASGQGVAYTSADELIIENSDHAGLSILTPANKGGYIAFGDPGDASIGIIKYDHSTDLLHLMTAGGTKDIVMDSLGKFGIMTVPTAFLDINSDILRLRTAKTPANAGAAGNQGDICWDADYIYVCVALNTWKRAAILTWV